MSPASGRWQQGFDGVRLLTCIVVALWLISVVVAVGTASLLTGAPSATPDRVVFISAGAFVTFAIPATAASVGLFFLRRSRRR